MIVSKGQHVCTIGTSNTAIPSVPSTFDLRNATSQLITIWYFYERKFWAVFNKCGDAPLLSKITFSHERVLKCCSKFPFIWLPYSNSMWCCVAQVESWQYAGKSNITGTNSTHLLSLHNNQDWFTFCHTPTTIYIDIQVLEKKTGIYFHKNSRGAPPQILNAPQNFL